MIDYSYIARSCTYYEKIGYKRLDAPWWASKEIVHITKPADVKDREDFYLPVNDKVLVASAEQSFLQMAKDGKLFDGIRGGRYYAVTPCFRNEPETKFSRKYFMKTELIDTTIVQNSSVHFMVNEALLFFKDIVPSPERLQVVKTEEGYDIEYSGVELGSYGKRVWVDNGHTLLEWVYGTGVAEPRLTLAINAVEENFNWPLL